AADPEELGERGRGLAHARLLVVSHLLETPPIAFVILAAAGAATAPVGAGAPVTERIVDRERQQPVAGAERRAPPLRQAHATWVFVSHRLRPFCILPRASGEGGPHCAAAWWKERGQ